MGGPSQRLTIDAVTQSNAISEAVRRALKRARSEGAAEDPSSDGPVPSDPDSEPEADVEVNPETKASEPEPTASTSEPVSAPEPAPAPEPTAKAEVKDVTSSPIDLFKSLLDMTHVPSGTEPAHFRTIAETLMQNFELCATSKSGGVAQYELFEIEFYWYNEHGGHIDPFTHAAEEQKVGLNWYFHRAPRRGPANIQSTAPVPSPKTNGFREGTRKGLDLTFGIPPTAPSDTPVAYGGILFRTIRNVQTKKVTCGPSLLVDELLRSCEVDSLPTLVGSVWAGDTSAFVSSPGPSRIFLRPVEKTDSKPPKIYTSPRVGLELSRIQTVGEVTSSHPRVRYVLRPYRFFTQPQLHGSVRPQTFYGFLQAHEAGQITRMGIADVSGMKPAQVSTYYGYLEAGRNAGRKAVAEFIGEKGKGVGPSPSRFLKMCGVVETVTGDAGAERAQKRQKLAPTLTSMFAGAKKK